MSASQAYAGEVSLLEIQAQEALLAEFCAALDPDALALGEIGEAHASLVRMRKLIAGAVTRVARRVEESRAWSRAGDRNAADYLARTEGTSKSQARQRLETSKRLRKLPDTDDALRRGELSEDQASEISDAASANPAAESELLAAAKTKSLPELRDQCRRRKRDADPDPEATYRRIRESRCLRRHSDAEGAYNLSLRTTPDDGAKIDAALQPVIDRIFGQARRQGRRESPDAYAADALVELVAGGSAPHSNGHSSRARESKVIALVDYEALRRGHSQHGETCEIAGVGPVPVSTVRAMLSDAFLALVVSDGVDVYTVAHPGRAVTAHQRSALEARGYRCEVPGCSVRHNLELDHISGWSITKRTALDDLAWECSHHHYLKTHCGYRLEGPPGNRRWINPHGVTVTADHNPPQQTHPPPATTSTATPLLAGTAI
jgi:hypothetical protein